MTTGRGSGTMLQVTVDAVGPAPLPRRAVTALVVLLAALAGAVVVAAVAVHGRTAGSATAAGVTDWWLWLTVTGVGYTAVGAWLAAVRPGLPVSWVVLLTGLLATVSLGALEYGVWALDRGDTGPLATAALWLGNWLWSAALLTIGAVLPLLLPDGRPARSRRPLLVLGLCVVGATAVVQALLPYDTWSPALVGAGAVNPVGVAWVAGQPQSTIAAAAGAVAVLLAWAGVGAEWRRSDGARRQQLKWVVLGAATALVLVALGLVFGPTLTALAMVPLPVAGAVAVLRHGLWSVDLVISRALVYALLAVGVGAVYVGCVAAVARVPGSGAGAVVLAAVVVALGVEPAHRRLRALVNRAVFGGPDDPLAVLGEVGRRLDGARDADDVAGALLPEVVSSVARALRLPYVAIALSDGTLAEHGGGAGALVERELSYAGAPVGRLLVATRPPGLGRSRQRSLDRLVGPAAVAAHTVLLSRDLARLRAHLATAREEERRRLYRELHDGLGPAVAALALQTETARDLLRTDPAAAEALLTAVVPQLRGTVGVVRGLVDGLRPAVLDHLGLAGAVRELGERFAGPDLAVSTSTDGLADLPAAVEVAAYRIVAESLANTARHAGAGAASVVLRARAGALAVSVEDDGRGCASAVAGTGWTSMRQRAAELGGRLEIGPAAGRGTRVVAHLPLVEEASCAS